MSEKGGSVHIIFVRRGHILHEPVINTLAAAATWSNLTHTELAIGNDFGQSGQMSNVCRIFNDDVGVELASRTGRNPQVGKPFSGVVCAICSNPVHSHWTKLRKDTSSHHGIAHTRKLMVCTLTLCVGSIPVCVFFAFRASTANRRTMVRSIIWPRESDDQSFFCAELVASVLKKGGLMSPNSNPGSATPQSLYDLYKKQAAVAANPYTLRQIAAPVRDAQYNTGHAVPQFRGLLEHPVKSTPKTIPLRKGTQRLRGDSPPRASFKCVSSYALPSRTGK